MRFKTHISLEANSVLKKTPDGNFSWGWNGAQLAAFNKEDLDRHTFVTGMIPEEQIHLGFYLRHE